MTKVVKWAVEKLRVLEQNIARWSKLTVSVHSSVCTGDFKFITDFYQQN
jgi:hypothetical protein